MATVKLSEAVKEAMADDFACPVCCETLGDPLLTVCGHTLCHDCDEKLAASGDTKCPQCRSQRAWPGKPLPQNFAMKQLWAMLQASATSESAEGEGADTDTHIRLEKGPVAYKTIAEVPSRACTVTTWHRGILQQPHPDGTVTVRPSAGGADVKLPVHMVFPQSFADTGEHAYINSMKFPDPPSSGMYRGKHVLACCNGKWLRATMVDPQAGKVTDKSTRLNVNLHLAELTEAVKLRNIQPLFEEGEAVDVRVDSNSATSKSSWMPGKITACYPDGTYDVHFETQPALSKVSPERVRERSRLLAPTDRTGRLRTKRVLHTRLPRHRSRSRSRSRSRPMGTQQSATFVRRTVAPPNPEIPENPSCGSSSSST